MLLSYLSVCSTSLNEAIMYLNFGSDLSRCCQRSDVTFPEEVWLRLDACILNRASIVHVVRRLPFTLLDGFSLLG